MDRFELARAGFVRDTASCLLALNDALAQAHGPNICAALLDIARAKGIACIAEEAGLHEEAIYAALADASQLDRVVVGRIADCLLMQLPEGGLLGDELP